MGNVIVIGVPHMIFIILIIGIYSGIIIYLIEVFYDYKIRNTNQKIMIDRLNQKLFIKQNSLETLTEVLHKYIDNHEKLLEEKSKKINYLYTKQAYLKAQNTAFYITLYNTLIETKIKLGKEAFKDFMKEVYFLQKQGLKKLEKIKIELDKNKK